MGTPIIPLGRTTRRRAEQQSQWQTETKQGVVTRTYADSVGNVTAVDVRVYGEKADHIGVPNMSTVKWAVGNPVTVNYLRGNRHNPQVTGGGGGGLTAGVSQDTGAVVPVQSQPPGQSFPVLTTVPDTDLPQASVLTSGANVTLTPGTDGSGNATLVVAAATSDHKVALSAADQAAGAAGYLDAKTGAVAPLAVNDVSGVRTFSLPKSTASVDGYLAYTDFTTFAAKEPALGSPAASGYVLSSTTAGVRSWVATPPRTLLIFVPGTLVAGVDTLEITVPSDFSSETLKRVTSRLRLASTSGSVTYTIQLATSTGAFTAAQTSNTITIASGVYQPADVTSFTSGITASSANAIRLNITAAGTGATDLLVKLEFS